MIFDAKSLICTIQKYLDDKNSQSYLVISDNLIVSQTSKVYILRNVLGERHTVLIDTIILTPQGIFVHDIAAGATIHDRTLLEVIILALSITPNEGE